MTEKEFFESICKEVNYLETIKERFDDLIEDEVLFEYFYMFTSRKIREYYGISED